MPLGSSSEAPVTSPGPRWAKYRTRGLWLWSAAPPGSRSRSRPSRAITRPSRRGGSAPLVLRPPAEQARLDLLDAEGHDDADDAEGEQRHHHVRRVEGAEGLDDQVAEAAA